MTDPKPKPNRIILGIVALAAVLLIGVVYLYRMYQPEKLEGRGTVQSIDAASRAIAIDFNHRRTGETFRAEGEVSLDCRIELDGQTVALDAIQPGQTVEAEGLLYRFPTQRIVATELIAETVKKPGNSESASETEVNPATRPPGGS